MKVTVTSSKPKISAEFTLSESPALEELQRAFASKYKSFYADRQRFTIEKDGKRVALVSSKKLNEQGVTDGTTIAFKDLGPQVGYKTVFLVEYGGPILIHALAFFLPALLSGRPAPTDYVQRLAFLMVLLHYFKREMETVFVHRFSHGTMPIVNIFKNCGHYWIFGGVLVAYELYAPTYVGTTNSTLISACLAVWVFAQLSNLSTHITLRNLRPAGTKERRIPYGYGFNLVSCPNYLFEIIGWVAFSVLVQTWTAYLFTFIGAAQMAQWAVKKHVAYKKEFGAKYPRGRKILVPFVW